MHDILLELENDLIESTKACIAEIDETAVKAASQPLNKLLLGVAPQSHFTRVFKESYGMTPTEFRKSER